MRKFVEPKSVALIGVSRQAKTEAFNILENLHSYGYQGRIYPVNPKASEILGVKAYPRVGEIAEGIDLAVINLPRELVPGIVKECTDKGIEAITIVTQGFADASDDRSKQLQREIDDVTRRAGARILGPNTLGTANAFTNFSSSFVKIKMERIPIGLICQTGVFYANSDLHLLGKGIDLGNSCDIDFADGLEYFEQDADTKVVALHIEGMRNAKRFLQVANRVARKKPIVALKTGRSDYAVQAVQSHTGSLVGKDEIWDVALKQSGVIRVSDVEELCDTVKAFSILPPMKGRGIGIVTFTGGFGVIGIDACQRFGLEVIKPSPVTLKQLSTMFPSWLATGNPVDIWPAVMSSERPVKEAIKAIKKAVESLFSGSAVDAVLCICGIWAEADCTEFCQIVEELTQSYPNKLLVYYLYGTRAAEAKARLEERTKTLTFASPDRAVRALWHLANYSDFRFSSTASLQ